MELCCKSFFLEQDESLYVYKAIIIVESTTIIEEKKLKKRIVCLQKIITSIKIGIPNKVHIKVFLKQFKIYCKIKFVLIRVDRNSKV